MANINSNAGSFNQLPESKVEASVSNKSLLVQQAGNQAEVKQENNPLNQFFQNLKRNANFETIEINHKTNKNLCFQMNEKQTVVYDYQKKALFKINTVHQNKEKKNFEQIVKSKKYADINLQAFGKQGLKNFFQKTFQEKKKEIESNIQKYKTQENIQNMSMLQNNYSINAGEDKEDENEENENQEDKIKVDESGDEEGDEDEGDEDEDDEESLQSNDDGQEEQSQKYGEITTVVCSSDKKKIFLGNSVGVTFILNAKTFQFLDYFKFDDEKEIKSLSGNGHIIVSATQKAAKVYDNQKGSVDFEYDDENGIIERVIVSPYSDHIVIQQTHQISAFKYSRIDRQEKGKLDPFEVKKIEYAEAQILKFTEECFFILGVNLFALQFQENKWKTFINLFEDKGSEQTKIQYIETMSDKKHLFVLGKNNQNEFKTCQIDFQGKKKTMVNQKESNFFVIYNDNDKVSLVDQSGLVLFKQTCQNVEINQLVQKDQELIYFKKMINNSNECEVKFIQICDRSLKAQACIYPLIINEKKNQIVINGQVKENQGKQTQTKILNLLDYTTKDFKKNENKQKINEKKYEKKENYAIYAISKDNNFYYAQNKENEIIQIESENFQNFQTILKGQSRRDFLVVDEKNKNLYYKQGKMIYQVEIVKDSKDVKVFEISEQHIKDWKLSFDGKFLLAISQTNLYKHDIGKKVTKKYSLKYIEILQPYSVNGHDCFEISVTNQPQETKQNNSLEDQSEEQINLENLDKITISPDDKYLALTSKKGNDIWIISLSDMKFQHRIEIFNEINSQTEREIQCYFKEQDKKKTYQAIMIIKNNTPDQVQQEIIGWDVADMKNWQRLFIIRDQLIEPIIGFNYQLEGLLIDKKIRVWSQIFDEYSSIIPNQLPKYDKNNANYISGPRNMIFPLIFKQFCEHDHHDETQLQLMPYMIKNIVVPYRFTFFSYLAFRSKGKLIKEALKKEDPKLVRDYLGFHPLHYLIIKSNFEQTSELIEYISNKPSLIEQLRSQEITDLLRFGPLFLEKFLNKLVKVLDEKECQKVDDNKQTFLEENGVQVKNYNHLKNQLTCQNPDDQMPAKFKMILVPLNLKFASKSSLELMKAIDENELLEIYRTDFMINIIERKWQEIYLISKYFLPIYCLPIIFVAFNTFHPSWYIGYYALIFFGFKYLIVEFIVFYKLGLTQKTNNNDSFREYIGKKLRFNSYASLLLGLLLLFYSFCNLYAFNYLYSCRCLPFITMLSWLCLIKDLEMFQLIREFNLKFIYSMEQSKGFLIFLILMIGTLTMTRTVLDKGKFRENIVEKLGYRNPSIDILADEEIHTTRDEDLIMTEQSMFSVIWSMVRGDFEAEKYDMFGKFVGTLIILITNVFLMNLLTAIVGDAFNEITTFSKELLLKQENFITLRLEAIISAFSWCQKSEENENLFWIDYDTQNTEEWKSQAYAITERISKVFQQIFNEKFELLQKNLQQLGTNNSKKDPDTQTEISTTEVNQENIDQNLQDFHKEINEIKNSQKSIEQVVATQNLIKTETDKLTAIQDKVNSFEQKVDGFLNNIQYEANSFQIETRTKIDTLNDSQSEILNQVARSQQSIQEKVEESQKQIQQNLKDLLQTEMKNEITQSKNQIVNLQNNQKQIQQKVEESQKQIQQKVEESQKQIQQKVANLETQVTNLKTQVENLQNQAVSFQAEVKNEISEMKNEITGTLAQILQKLQEKE